MTVLLNSTFEGVNGDPWPSPWDTALVGGTSGGGFFLMSNRGVIEAYAGGYNTARADASGIVTENVLIQGTIRFPGSDPARERYIKIWARSGGWSPSSPWNKSNGYLLLMAMGHSSSVDSELTIGKYVNGNRTYFDSKFLTGPDSYKTDVDYNFKFSVNTQLIQAKYWEFGTTEPNWQLNAIDFSYSSGGAAISLLSGDGTTGGREARFDNFTVTTLEVPPTLYASDWTNYITRSTVGSPEQSNNRQFFTYNGTELVPVDMYVGGP